MDTLGLGPRSHVHHRPVSIGGVATVDSPLDRRVVEAYWIGNELVATVPPAALAASLDRGFAGRAGRRFEPLVAAVGTGGVAQHSFHVLAASPWLGLLRSGREGPPLEVLDRCRIRWGRVVSVTGDVTLVRSRPLAFDGTRLALRAERVEEARWALGGAHLVAAPGLRVGDAVSLHWDWVCDVLSPAALWWLRATTRRNLGAVNALARPGPAVACGA